MAKNYKNHLGFKTKDESNKKGKYYVIYHGSEISIGKIKEIEPGKILLNPFKGYRYDSKKKKLLYKLIEEDVEIRFINPSILKFEPTTKETLEQICKEQNEEKYKSQKSK